MFVSLSMVAMGILFLIISFKYYLHVASCSISVGINIGKMWSTLHIQIKSLQRPTSPALFQLVVLTINIKNYTNRVLRHTVGVSIIYNNESKRIYLLYLLIFESLKV